MKVVLRTLFWILIVVVLVASLDVVMQRATFEQPMLQAGQQFYVDFRRRLLGLWGPSSIEGVIEQRAEEPAAPETAPHSGKTRYLYKDADGQLQFADSLDEVPPHYRKEAQPLYP